MMDDLVKRADEVLKDVTPGPWRVCIDDDGNPLSGRPSIEAPEDCDCAIIHWDGFVQEYWRSARGDREIHANARFIAAARDLVPAMRDRIEADAARIAELEQKHMGAERVCDILDNQRHAAEARVSEAVVMLAEKDAEYARKTNEMIERHAEQITQLKARIAELEAARGQAKREARMEAMRVASLSVELEDACNSNEAMATRIKELEAALREIEADCDAEYPPSHGAIKYCIRAALGEKKG